MNIDTLILTRLIQKIFNKKSIKSIKINNLWNAL